MTIVALVAQALLYVTVIVSGARLLIPRFGGAITRVRMARLALAAPVAVCVVALALPMSLWSVEIPAAGPEIRVPQGAGQQRVRIARADLAAMTEMSPAAAGWATALAVIWFAGVCVGARGLWRGWQRQRELMHSATPLANRAVTRFVQCLTVRARMVRPVSLWTSGKAAMPMACWGGRVLLPPRALTEFSPAALEAVVAHEVGHVARCDAGWLIAGEIVAVLLWCVPGVRSLVDRARADAELVADAWAVAHTRDPYALAEALTHASEWPHEPGLSPAAASGGHLIVKRIEHLLAPSRPASTRLSLAVVIVALLAALALAVVPQVRMPALSELTIATSDGPVRLVVPSR